MRGICLINESDARNASYFFAAQQQQISNITQNIQGEPKNYLMTRKVIYNQNVQYQYFS